MSTAAYHRAYYLEHQGASRRRFVPGTERQSKTCKKCGLMKQRGEFTVRASGPRVGHLSSYCKPCTSKAVGLAYLEKNKRDPTVYRRCEWPSKLKRLYGITVDDYHAMLARQGGGCAVCGTTDPMHGSRNYKRRSRTAFDVDHCHKTGMVRGLLCTRCNRLVGLANDDPDTARRLVRYLS
jgi:hypothetical protein